MENGNTRPFDPADGDPNLIMADCMRHTETLIRVCREHIQDLQELELALCCSG